MSATANHLAVMPHLRSDVDTRPRVERGFQWSAERLVARHEATMKATANLRPWLDFNKQAKPR